MKEEELKDRLSPEAYDVLRNKGTEAPFSGKLLYNDKEGLYNCGVCGRPLFDWDKKYQDGSGWPSFCDALPGAVKFQPDDSHGMHRQEVICANCGSHLGHIFDDGPAVLGGKHYCINSAALDFKENK